MAWIGASDDYMACSPDRVRNSKQPVRECAMRTRLTWTKNCSVINCAASRGAL
jgi:hypothetical protein